MLWLFRALWLVLPFTAGPLFADALDDTERTFQLGVTLGLWVMWAVILVASMVPRTQTFTLIRVVAPMAAVATIWAAIAGELDDGVVRVLVAIVSAVVAMIVALSAPIGDAFVDGSSYGDETRFLLRTPGALMLGPLPLAWLAIAAGAVIGPLLLLSERWIAGGVAVAIGWPLAYFATPILHRLSDRWLVFVPAGLVVHDKTALREPQLFRKDSIAAFGPAPSDSGLEDLSLGGFGLALRAELVEETKVIRNERSENIELTPVTGVIVSPNRPGAVVAEANTRGFPIG